MGSESTADQKWMVPPANHANGLLGEGQTSSQQVRRQGIGLLLVGAATFGLGVWGLWRDVVWIAEPFYGYAWWGYIIALDGFVAWKTGNSLLTSRRRHLLPLLIWSCTFWYIFELLNLRFQNWYYVGAFRTLWAGYAFSLIAFSTVLIGMFETFEAVTATGLWRNWRGKDRKFSGWVSYAVQGLGLAMAGAAILFPYYLAPLIWGSLSFLIDPWNYRRGARSILHDFEVGDFGLVARLLFAGLICGGVWESMNFAAPQKWIYTVRGLESLKLFEMPLLGFLGFPALALDGMAFYSMLSYKFLGNQSWENPRNLRYSLVPKPTPPKRFFLASIPLQIIFGALVLIGVRQVNIASAKVELEDLRTLSTEEIQVLESVGITRPIRLYREGRSDDRAEGLRTILGVDATKYGQIIDEVALYVFKGIGAWHGFLLREAGISRIEDLARWRPEDLYEAMKPVSDLHDIRMPRLDMVRVWILAARDRGVVMNGNSH